MKYDTNQRLEYLILIHLNYVSNSLIQWMKHLRSAPNATPLRVINADRTSAKIWLVILVLVGCELIKGSIASRVPFCIITMQWVGCNVV